MIKAWNRRPHWEMLIQATPIMRPLSLLLWTLLLTWSVVLGQVSSGPSKSMVNGYLLIGCNVPHTRHLTTILSQMKSDVQSVIADVDHGTASRHGFRSFFKTDANVKNVRAVFESIANNYAIYATHPAIVGLRPPTILCYDGRATDAIDATHYRHNCGWEPGQVFATVAVSTHETASIALCGSFWHFPPGPTNDQCPLLTGNRQSRKLDNNANLVENQYSLLIHELVHLYNPHDPPDDYVETYNIQDAVNLNSTESLENAANYAYYASGWLHLLLRLQLKANSTQPS